MNLFLIDIQQSKIIPIVTISLILIQLCVSFFDMEMFLASYAALAGVLIAFLVAFILLVRKKSIHKFDSIILLFIVTLESITLFTGADWKNWLYLAFSICAYLFVFNYYQERYKTIILTILSVMSVLVYCQLFQCITHPEMWISEEAKELHGYLLGGNYNQMASRLMIALLAGILSIQYSKLFWLNLIPLFISCFAIMLMVKSMTALTCLFFFLIFCLIRNQRLLSLGIICLYIGILLFQIVVCFSGKGFENNEFARWLIIDLLDKDMTFTGRTVLWDFALRLIVKSPIWGYGFVDAEWFKANMASFGIGAHNFILNTMIYGGIVLLILYIGLIIKCLQHLISINDIYSKRMMAAFGVMSAMMLFEVYEFPLVFLLLTIMYYYPGISLHTETLHERKQQ